MNSEKELGIEICNPVEFTINLDLSMGSTNLLSLSPVSKQRQATWMPQQGKIRRCLTRRSKREMKAIVLNPLAFFCKLRNDILSDSQLQYLIGHTYWDLRQPARNKLPGGSASAGQSRHRMNGAWVVYFGLAALETWTTPLAVFESLLTQNRSMNPIQNVFFIVSGSKTSLRRLLPRRVVIFHWPIQAIIGDL